MRDAAHGLANGVGNGATGTGAIIVLRQLLAFNPNRNASHRRHCFYWVLSHRRFVGKHHCIGTVEDGIGHVGNFCPRRPGVIGHAVQHLGGGDDRQSQTIGRGNEPLLQNGYVFRWQFHPQISPCHHDAIAKGENGIHLLDRLMFLNLGNDGNLFACIGNEFFDFQQVLGIAHKAEGDPVNPLIEAEHQVFSIFLGQRFDREVDAGKVHAFAIRQFPPNNDLAVQFPCLPIDFFHTHFHAAIIEQDGGSLGNFVYQWRIGDGADLLGTRNRFAGEDEGIASL